MLVSGSGTILEAMLDAGLAIALVASDRPCRALDVAENAGVEAVLVPRANYGGFTSSFERERYSAQLARALQDHSIDLIAMAGFGTVLSASFHSAFPGRVLNTHPSLLPEFKGWHAVAQAIEAKVSESGCTVHIATLELDDGPILAQRGVPVYSSDDEAVLHERIKMVERELYPLVVGRVMTALAAGLEPAATVDTQEGDQ